MYFDSFPKILYDSKGNGEVKIVTNLLKRVAIRTKVKNNSGVRKLDHVVINTNDAEGFIKIHRDFFKIRLALDKIIEHWDRRMLFFRLNKTTIEVIEEKDEILFLSSNTWDVSGAGNFGFNAIWVNRNNGVFDNLDFKPKNQIKNLLELIELTKI